MTYRSSHMPRLTTRAMTNSARGEDRTRRDHSNCGATTLHATSAQMAPATKYGGKMVECHPGTMATAKSKLTTVCTDTTSGVANPASSKYAVSYRCQCRADPRHPIARTP